MANFSRLSNQILVHYKNFLGQYAEAPELICKKHATSPWIGMISRSAELLVRPRPKMLDLILLPGMDGTGLLFAEFVQALGDRHSTDVIEYPNDMSLDTPSWRIWFVGGCLRIGRLCFWLNRFPDPLLFQ